MQRLSSDEIVDLADRNLAEFVRVGALWRREGEVQIGDDVQFVASATRFPAGTFNCVHPLGAPPDRLRARAWVDRALQYYAVRERGFCVSARGERDGELARECAERGMHPLDGGPGMVLDATVTPARPIDGLSIVQITDQAGVADFVAVAAPAYELLSLPAAVTRQSFSDPARVLGSGISLYVAYLEGRPAATGLTVASHGIAGLYWVATCSDLQRRGLADALTRRASNDAFARGAAFVILQASPFGEPVYRRIGYRPIARYTRFFLTRVQCLDAARAVSSPQPP